MAYQFSDDLITGNPMIDTEHKQLIAAINDLLAACSSGKGRSELEKTTSFLVRYTETHFSHEEKLQMQYQYPDYRNHKVYHDTFKRTVAELVKKLDVQGPTVALVGEVNSAIAGWLISHIKREDKKVAEHIRQATK